MMNDGKMGGEEKGSWEGHACPMCQGSGKMHGGMGCWGWGRHGYHRHMLIKILIAIFIFWAGYNLGELKGELRAYRGFDGGHMSLWGFGNDGYGNFGDMRVFMNQYMRTSTSTLPTK
jgi:hypothetical protein